MPEAANASAAPISPAAQRRPTSARAGPATEESPCFAPFHGLSAVGCGPLLTICLLRGNRTTNRRF